MVKKKSMEQIECLGSWLQIPYTITRHKLNSKTRNSEAGIPREQRTENANDRVGCTVEKVLNYSSLFASIRPYRDSRSEQISSTVEITTSPVSFKVEIDLSFSSWFLEPHASEATTGMRLRSVPCRTVGSIPTSIAMPAMTNAFSWASLKARLRKVLSNADMVTLSTMTSSACGASSGTIRHGALS